MQITSMPKKWFFPHFARVKSQTDSADIVHTVWAEKRRAGRFEQAAWAASAPETAAEIAWPVSSGCRRPALEERQRAEQRQKQHQPVLAARSHHSRQHQAPRRQEHVRGVRGEGTPCTQKVLKIQ